MGINMKPFDLEKALAGEPVELHVVLSKYFIIEYQTTTHTVTGKITLYFTRRWYS